MKIDILNLAASTNYAQTKLESKLLISNKFIFFNSYAVLTTLLKYILIK